MSEEENVRYVVEDDAYCNTCCSRDSVEWVIGELVKRK
jgi:hypothetical protein